MYVDRQEDETFNKFNLNKDEDQFLWYYNPTNDALAPRICIPNNRALRQLILSQHHSNKYCGHYGPVKMQELIERSYYWQGMATDCKTFHKSCPECQRNKHDRNANRRIPAAEWKAPKTPAHTIGMDFVGQLPTTKKGHDYIFVLIDRLSKKGTFIACKTTSTTEEIANLFCEHFVRHEGIPTCLLSDRDKLFTSEFWKEVWRLMGVTLAMSSAYHYQTDGVTERLNAELKKYLRLYAKENQDWG